MSTQLLNPSPPTVNVADHQQEVLVRFVRASDERAWNEFVNKSSDATAFHQWGWQQIVSEVHKHQNKSLLAIRGNEIVGLMPLFRNKTLLFGHSFSSSPFCPYGGPIGLDDQIRLKLTQFALAESSSDGATFLELRHLNNRVESAQTQDIYVTFRKSLSADHDENMLAIPRKQRAMVRKGVQNNLIAEEGSIRDFFELYEDNIHRHGTPGSPIAFFEAMQHFLPNSTEVLVVRSPAGKVLSAVFSLYFKDEVLPFYAGDLTDARSLAANDFKYWALMQRAVEKGARIFDYGRSKKGTGPFSFKKNWGFEPTQLHYQYYGLMGQPIPENNPLNPKYRRMISVWRKLPRSIVGKVGPIVVRGLG
jgi:FemAB-related protein (PEP-CTERM system-associated)